METEIATKIADKIKKIQNELIDIALIIGQNNQNNNETIEKADELNIDDILKVCGSVQKEAKETKRKAKPQLSDDNIEMNRNFTNDDLKDFFNDKNPPKI